MEVAGRRAAERVEMAVWLEGLVISEILGLVFTGSVLRVPEFGSGG